MSVEFKTSPEGKLRKSVLADRLRDLKQQSPYMNISHYTGFQVHKKTSVIASRQPTELSSGVAEAPRRCDRTL
jgi:pectate lyase